MSKHSLDIILPVYNPNQGWATDLIRQFSEFEIRINEVAKAHLIVVNDGSIIDLDEDKSILISSIPNLTYLDYTENRGKGYALRKGVSHSKSDFTIYTDYDVPYTYGSMEKILMTMVNQEKPVVIGHRDANYYKDLPWLRVKISHYLKTINRFILGLNTDDTQCGLKGFQGQVRDIFLQTKTNRFMIDIEFLRRLKRAKIPVTVLDVKSRDNVLMSPLKFRTIFSELWAYIKIFFTT